jgi:cytochrome c
MDARVNPRGRGDGRSPAHNGQGGAYTVARDEANLYQSAAAPSGRGFRQYLPAVVLRSRPSMNSFELNKILGAVLFTFLCILALNITAGAIFAPVKPDKPGFAIAVPEKQDAAPGAPAEPEKPIAELLANASAERGQAAAKVCVACHTFEKSGPNKVGPNLWGIVGNKHAHAGNFDYSAAMKSKSGEQWTYEALNTYLKNPRAAVPGTKMAFAGISRDSQRADVIAYLRTLADNPVPLPKVAEGQPAAPEGQKPAGGQKAPAPQPK